jgi:hypothetical protein
MLCIVVPVRWKSLPTRIMSESENSSKKSGFVNVPLPFVGGPRLREHRPCEREHSATRSFVSRRRVMRHLSR